MDIAFNDFGKKRKDFKHNMKQSLKLKKGETLEDILRTTPNLNLYDADDIECTISKWLTDEDWVRTHEHYDI